MALHKKCKFGPKGKNHNGKCSFLHPPTCFDFERGQNGCQKSDCKYLHRPAVEEPRFQESHNRGWNPPRNNFRQGPSHDIAFLGRSITEVLERFFIFFKYCAYGYTVGWNFDLVVFCSSWFLIRWVGSSKFILCFFLGIRFLVSCEAESESDCSKSPWKYVVQFVVGSSFSQTMKI